MEFQPSFDSEGDSQEPTAETDKSLGELLVARKELDLMVQADTEARSKLPHLPTFEEILERSKKLGEEAGRDEFFFRKQVKESLNYNALFQQHAETSHPFLNRAVELLEEGYPWEYLFTSENKNGRGNSVYFVDGEGHSQRLKTSLLGEEGLKGVVEPMNDLIVFEKEGVSHSETRPPELRAQLKEKYGDAFVDYYMASNVSFEPREGWTVQEYCSKDFLEDQKSEKPTSEGRYVRYKLDDGVIVILCDDLYSTHTGHKVKWIEGKK